VHIQQETAFQPYFEESLGEAHFEALELLSSEKDLAIRTKLPHIHVTKVGVLSTVDVPVLHILLLSYAFFYILYEFIWRLHTLSEHITTTNHIPCSE
jgi:hypothetical protein